MKVFYQDPPRLRRQRQIFLWHECWRAICLR